MNGIGPSTVVLCRVVHIADISLQKGEGPPVGDSTRAGRGPKVSKREDRDTKSINEKRESTLPPNGKRVLKPLYGYLAL